MSGSRWVRIPVEPWPDPSAEVVYAIYLAFEPLLPQENGEAGLLDVRAWVRLVVATIFRGRDFGGNYCHVDIGSDWRRLLNARLQALPGGSSALYYADGRAVKLEGPPKAPPSLPEHLVAALQQRWLKDYHQELADS